MYTFDRMIGQSPSMQHIRELLEKVQVSDSTVLLLGASGTGKELLARSIHEQSSRAQHPFLAINCGAIPHDLLESELFGHEKGAFTGAIQSRAGRFELAEGGTLFLDEIGDMPLNMQVKLLRVLQEKQFERVGGKFLIEANVRIIAATHRNLQEELSQGRFREDLYYRLNVFPISLPPLKERAEDIPLLIQYFRETLSKVRHIDFELTEEAIGYLKNYSWPGNIRELSNLIERLSVLYPGQVVDLPKLNPLFSENKFSLPIFISSFNLKEHIESIERQYIEKALKECEGVVSQAAERLGLRRTTLIEKMKRYWIEK